jgi:hypothetical protein
MAAGAPHSAGIPVLARAPPNTKQAVTAIKRILTPKEFDLAEPLRMSRNYRLRVCILQHLNFRILAPSFA